MASLFPCPSCARHVRRTESACPFCKSTVSFEGVPERPLPPPRLGRGALLAFGAMIAAGSPGCTTTPSPNDTGVDAYYGGGGDAYGAPPHDAYGSIGDVYGAPDVGFLEDTGSTPDAGPADDAGTGGDGG